MPRPCSVCSHLDRDAIDMALVGGSTLAAIGERYEVTRDSLARHRSNHVSPAVRRLAQTRRNDASAVAISDRLEEVIDQVKRLVDRAEQKGSLVAGAQLIGQWRQALETLAKLSGELSDRPVVNVLNVASSPDWIALRSAILSALQSYPDARLAVVDALQVARPAALEAAR